MGYPVGRIVCSHCGREVVEWDCGTPGHSCWKDVPTGIDQYGNWIYKNHACGAA